MSNNPNINTLDDIKSIISIEKTDNKVYVRNKPVAKKTKQTFENKIKIAKMKTDHPMYLKNLIIEDYKGLFKFPMNSTRFMRFNSTSKLLAEQGVGGEISLLEFYMGENFNNVTLEILMFILNEFFIDVIENNIMQFGFNNYISINSVMSSNFKIEDYYLFINKSSSVSPSSVLCLGHYPTNTYLDSINIKLNQLVHDISNKNSAPQYVFQLLKDTLDI